MMSSNFIIDVNEASFEYEVLAYSQQMPVIVDFWAEWCIPCKTLGPMLERLANEAQGSFRLARVDVDQNQNLALRYAVRSIPAVKAFRNGKMVAEFTGVQPEPRLREFLRSVAPSQNDLALEKGNSLLILGRAQEAEQAYQSVLESTPAYPPALLGLAKALLLQGRPREASSILTNFPPSREYSSAETLAPLASTLVRLETGPADPQELALDPAYRNALRLFQRGNIEAAMDGLLDILREDKRFRNGEPRRVLVAILELLGEENAAARQYRAELASVLF